MTYELIENIVLILGGFWLGAVSGLNEDNLESVWSVMIYRKVQKALGHG